MATVATVSAPVIPVGQEARVTGIVEQRFHVEFDLERPGLRLGFRYGRRDRQGGQRDGGNEIEQKLRSFHVQEFSTVSANTRKY